MTQAAADGQLRSDIRDLIHDLKAVTIKCHAFGVVLSGSDDIHR